MTERGLLLKPDWAELFASGKKCLEIRNYFCRCLKVGDSVSIVASAQGKNSRGVTVLKILGSMKFVQNISIEEKDFKKFFNQHRVSQTTFKEFLSTWSSGKSKSVKVVGWEFSDIQKFDVPKWIKWNHET